MAWATPATRATGYIVLAADWNVLVDDLKYLKGQAGDVALEDDLALYTSGRTKLGMRGDSDTHKVQLGIWANGQGASGVTVVQGFYNAAGTILTAPLLALGGDGSFTSQTVHIVNAGGAQGGGLAPRFWVPASAWSVQAGAGQADPVVQEFSSGFKTTVLNFDPAGDESADFSCAAPYNYLATRNVKVRIAWRANATSGDCFWEILAFYVVAGSATVGTMTSRVSYQYTTDSTANDLTVNELTWTSSTEPPAGSIVHFKIKRQGTNAADTLAVDAQLLGVWFEFGS